MRVLLFLAVLSSLCLAEISQEIYKGIKHDEKLIKDKKINESIGHLKQLLQKAKTNEEKSHIFKLLSNRYLSKDDYKNASKYLNQALHVDKNKDEIILSLSSMYLNQDRYKDCIKTLKKAKKQTRDIQKNLAICYYYNGSYKIAIKYGQRYLKGKRKDKEMVNLLYNASINQGDYKKASEYFKQMATKKDEKYYIQLASMYDKAKMREDALALLDFAYKKGVLKEEKGINYYLYLLNDNHLYTKAIGILKKSFPSKIEQIINLYVLAKDYKNAIKTLSSLKRLSAKNSLLLAQLYFKNQDYKNTIKTLSNATLAPNSTHEGEMFILKALSYYQLKEMESFKNTLLQALLNKHVKNRARSMLAYAN